jgi:hypothetical protein
MKKLKKLIVSTLLLLAALGFLVLITEMPSVSASAYDDFCVENASLYCWSSFPYWFCHSAAGGLHCLDPVN